jgi:predicted cupin superfamily sugar epimerase
MTENSGRLENIIKKLGLEAHPEGGWYRRTYQSEYILPSEALPRHPGNRHCATSIYFLITSENFSSFHRIRSDEMWYHHSGGAITINIIHDDGTLNSIVLGPVEEGYEPQALAPADTWFASHLLEESDWALVGCSVAPGFDFDDFEIGKRSELIDTYPQHKHLISSLTRE